MRFDSIRTAAKLLVSLLLVSFVPGPSGGQAPKAATAIRPVAEGAPKPSLPYKPIATGTKTSGSSTSEASLEADLLVAVWEGDLAKVGALLSEGADPDTKGDSNGAAPLHWAVARDSQHIVERLLQAGADVDATDAEGATPLHLAAELGLISVMEVLLKADAGLELRRTDGATPLIVAAAADQAVAAGVLLEEGSDIEAKDENGWTPLMVASGALEDTKVLVARALIAEGANMNARSDVGHVTALHAAAAAGGVVWTARELISAGAKIDTQDSAGFTPLAAAAYYGHTTLVFLLMELGADRDVATTAGTTALDVACGCVGDGAQEDGFCESETCQHEKFSIIALLTRPESRRGQRIVEK